ENCHLVIEAKRLGAGVEGALEQARGYVEALGVARDVVVTDGIRYRMYAGGHEFEPMAYANLARLKTAGGDAVRTHEETVGGSQWSPGTRSRPRARKSAKGARSIRTSSPSPWSRSWPGPRRRTTAIRRSSSPAPVSRGRCASTPGWFCA